MMTKKHTPGPWRIERPPHRKGLSSSLLERHPDAIHIVSSGTIWGFGVSIAALSDTEENEANATLIASAPDLLAERDALRATLETLMALAQSPAYRVRMTQMAMCGFLDDVESIISAALGAEEAA
jgi:hypothetical protein